MLVVAAPLPIRRPGLRVSQLGEDGRYVVKNARRGSYLHLGEQEHFLLMQLDGRRDAEAIRRAFVDRFEEPLSDEDLDDFLQLAAAQDLIAEPGQHDQQPATATSHGSDRPTADSSPRPRSDAPARPRQSLLNWRKSLFDPDRLFSWLEPRLRFFWTRSFLILSAGCIVLATIVLWANRLELAGAVQSALRWETAVLVWLTLFVITTLHEFAHGLTCKHHGGEVHEIGFLLLFFMPCFYCNVSDAWLFREKSKRLWVTFAGGYFELFVWALAVFAWRLTLPGTLVHHLALIVASICGIQSLFNFNPLIKLDGYYLLSDWVGIPNLQQRAFDRLKARLRWLLWGAARPEQDPRERFLLGYGLLSWIYSLVFLTVMIVALSQVVRAGWGPAGVAGVGLVGLLAMRGMLHGTSGGEIRQMFLHRHKRAALWLAGMTALAAAGCLVHIEGRAKGPFEVRPVVRAEVRAPVAGFLRDVCVDEGDRVAVGATLVRLEIPDLASRLGQKQAELRESAARLRLLQAGARPEELREQRDRVERAVAWRDLAERDLARRRQAFEQDLARLEHRVAACAAEREIAGQRYERARSLLSQRAASEEELREAERRWRLAEAEWEQARAEYQAHQEVGLLEAEEELARRDRELAEARAALALLEAGSRPEEIEAEQARLARLQQEIEYLKQLERRLTVSSPVSGVITTARLREKVGQFLAEGDAICLVEQIESLTAEIELAEQDAARIRPGQKVRLKARALPFQTIPATVERIAPAARTGAAQSTVTLHCGLSPGSDALRPGMTGYARVTTERRPVARVLLDRVMRYVRTEFWW